MLHRVVFAPRVLVAALAVSTLVLGSACNSPSPPADTRSRPAATLEPVVAASVAAAVEPATVAAVPNGEDWNDAQIAWQPFAQGLSLAATQRKPVCLVLFTNWCSHCKNHSRLFSDARVVAAAKDFVMIKLDRDADKELSRKYAPDGDYIPRTHFLASNGTLDADIHAQRPQFKYFYDESDPASLLAGMAEARTKLN